MHQQAVTVACHNMSAVGRDGDRQHLSVVTAKLANLPPGFQVPNQRRLVSRNGHSRYVNFDLEDPQYLGFFEYAQLQSGKKIEDHLAGWRKIHVTNFEHPYMDHWWVPGCTIGYEHTFVHALSDFLKGLETGKPVQPNFRTALATQRVCDAVLDSARDGQWVSIDPFATNS